MIADEKAEGDVGCVEEGLGEVVTDGESVEKASEEGGEVVVQIALLASLNRLAAF